MQYRFAVNFGTLRSLGCQNIRIISIVKNINYFTLLWLAFTDHNHFLFSVSGPGVPVLMVREPDWRLNQHFFSINNRKEHKFYLHMLNAYCSV